MEITFARRILFVFWTKLCIFAWKVINLATSNLYQVYRNVFVGFLAKWKVNFVPGNSPIIDAAEPKIVYFEHKPNIQT